MFVIKNIKFSLKIKNISLNSVLDELKEQKINFETKGNYVVIRDIYVYILFRSRSFILNHINITKIPSVNQINFSVDHLQRKILKNLKIEICKEQIDNLTATYNIGQEINQLRFLQKNKKHHTIKFNKEKFPGLFIKVPLGTFIIFHTGKINVVGCQSPFHLFQLFYFLQDLLN